MKFFSFFSITIVIKDIDYPPNKNLRFLLGGGGGLGTKMSSKYGPVRFVENPHKVHFCDDFCDIFATFSQRFRNIALHICGWAKTEVYIERSRGERSRIFFNFFFLHRERCASVVQA